MSGAQVASQFAQTTDNTRQRRVAGVLWTVAKKAIKTALIHGRNLLPAKIRPWADKIVDVIDTIDDFSEGALIFGLQGAGVPYDVARGIAQWVTTFLI